MLQLKLPSKCTKTACELFHPIQEERTHHILHDEVAALNATCLACHIRWKRKDTVAVRRTWLMGLTTSFHNEASWPLSEWHTRWKRDAVLQCMQQMKAASSQTLRSSSRSYLATYRCQRDPGLLQAGLLISGVVNILSCYIS